MNAWNNVLAFNDENYKLSVSKLEFLIERVKSLISCCAISVIIHLFSVLKCLGSLFGYKCYFIFRNSSNNLLF